MLNFLPELFFLFYIDGRILLLVLGRLESCLGFVFGIYDGHQVVFCQFCSRQFLECHDLRVDVLIRAIQPFLEFFPTEIFDGSFDDFLEPSFGLVDFLFRL